MLFLGKIVFIPVYAAIVKIFLFSDTANLTADRLCHLSPHSLILLSAFWELVLWQALNYFQVTAWKMKDWEIKQTFWGQLNSD